jgi:hypothetical protein
MNEEGRDMWDTVEAAQHTTSHDLPCLRCGHAAHIYLACDARCDCVPAAMPGQSLAGATLA